MHEGILMMAAFFCVMGVVVGISTSIVTGINIYAESMWLMIAVTVVISELMFFLWDDKKPKKKDSKFWFTAERKLIYLIPTAVLVACLSGYVFAAAAAIPEIDWQPIIYFIGWGTATFISFVVIGYVVVQINMLKFRK